MNEYEVKEEDLILYGQSVGSGPTLHLASRLEKLRGVVLHSAILSGIRVLCPIKMTFWFDIYKNIDKIRQVNCPVLVIHEIEAKFEEKYNSLQKLVEDQNQMIAQMRDELQTAKMGQQSSSLMPSSSDNPPAHRSLGDSHMD
ncbi:alpha/beta hydrolase domain-containing protein 17C-like isoform X4 [Manihot esculenta]|uniref:alpha/beta hydrolase domain-containing protein 17C-like isoform X4 n=1 Tax=Manihot esculenta TaxID=3983 RepID=UPI001CC62E9D|nr:alpha/beta hydrolase domain-containing protein 17C-like isoform X4 [Manihot esculenta]XP_043813899.1 alpha/beta hydrolase domain-containing protein 17C-like isoform X4 [Manihot esculenta]